MFPNFDVEFQLKLHQVPRTEPKERLSLLVRWKTVPNTGLARADEDVRPPLGRPPVILSPPPSATRSDRREDIHKWSEPNDGGVNYS